MKVVYTVIVVILILFIITFSLANTFPVQLRYLDIFNVVLPAYMLIFICFLIGVVFTGFMGIVERFRLNRTIAHLNKTIRELRREIRANEPPPIIDDKEGAGPA
ncbi:MAG: LapA family protein [Syntrophales bacterium]